MERKFYTNDFENLLKENADRFKMYPSKKVWKGIYNDMHPGRRWPSVAMSLFLICSLVIVGNLNSPHSQKINFADLQIQKLESNPGKVNDLKSAKRTLKAKRKVIDAPKTDQFISAISDAENKDIDYKSGGVNLADKTGINNEAINVSNSEASDEVTIVMLENSGHILPKSLTVNQESMAQDRVIVGTTNSDNLKVKISTSASSVIPINNGEKLKTTANNINQKTEIIATNSSGSQNQNNSFHPFRLRSKKLNWAYYFTPSVSYRVMFENGNANQPSSYNNNINDYVDHSPAPGFEAGTALKYSFTKKFKFTSGLQLNYSAYNIQANNIHPMLATVIVNSPALARPVISNGISFFANGSGASPVTLHNYSFQASVPIGFEYILAEDNYIQLGAAVNVQPSYVITSHSYILSSDKRNYLTQPDLLRSFNMNTGAGLFVNFKSKWIEVQVGPQLRYQLLSTYKKAYPLSEHLINYGMRFSVSKTMR